MRFRFCGDLDCPDWILAEINSMARLSSIKMKLLSQQVAKSLLGDEIDYDKVKKLTADAKFDRNDVKACLAAISFVLTSSCRYGVDEDALNSELQQLGMPKEHATALCKVHSEHMPAITAKLREDSLRLSRLEDVQWRLDLVSSSSRGQEGGPPTPEVQIGLKVNHPSTNVVTTHHLCMSPSQLQLLITELKKAANTIETLEK